jgi:hypothetical protein
MMADKWASRTDVSITAIPHCVGKSMEKMKKMGKSISGVNEENNGSN